MMLTGLGKTVAEGCLCYVKIHNLKEFTEYAKSINLLDNKQKTWKDLDVGQFRGELNEVGIWDSHGQLWAGGRGRNEVIQNAKKRLQDNNIKNECAPYFILTSRGIAIDNYDRFQEIKFDFKREVKEKTNELTNEELTKNIMEVIEENREDLISQLNLTNHNAAEKIVNTIFKLGEETESNIKEILEKEKERKKIDKELSKYELTITNWLRALGIHEYYDISPGLALTYQIIGSALLKIDFPNNPTENISNLFYDALSSSKYTKNNKVFTLGYLYYCNGHTDENWELMEYLGMGQYSVDSSCGIIKAVAKGIVNEDWSKLEEDLNKFSNRKKFIDELIGKLKELDIDDVFSKSENVHKILPTKLGVPGIKKRRKIEKAYIKKYCLGKDV